MGQYRMTNPNADDTEGQCPKPRRRLLPPYARKRLWVLVIVSAILVLFWSGPYAAVSSIRHSTPQVGFGEAVSAISNVSFSDLSAGAKSFLVTVSVVAVVLTLIYVFNKRMLNRVIVIHLAIILPAVSAALSDSGFERMIGFQPLTIVAALFYTPQIFLGTVDGESYSEAQAMFWANGWWLILWLCILLGEVGAWFVQSQRRGQQHEARS